MKTKIKNPYSKYSYNTGLVTTDNKPVYGLDIKWLMFEIKQGRLPKLKNTISNGASESWYATYDEAMDRAIFLIRLNVESYKTRTDYNTVMVYEGEEKTLTETHGVPCGRVIFNWRNYK